MFREDRHRIIYGVNDPFPGKEFGETRSEKYVIFGGTFAEFFRILFGKFVWMSSKFGFNYEV
jgi:hypothetical protein